MSDVTEVKPKLGQKAYRAAWHQRNKVRRAAEAKERAKNDPTIKARRVKATLKCRSKNPEKYKAYMREYQKSHPEKFAAAAQKRRALQKSATINLQSIEAWMKSVRSKKSATCYYCQESFPSSEIHFDHIIALSKGGPHSVENLCVSCAECNHRKSATSLRAWVRIGQMNLEL